MRLRKFMSLLAIVLGFIGTVFLLFGVLRMTPDVISEIGQPRYDYSVPVLKNLSIQKADTICGFIFVVIAFCLQLTQTLCNFSAIRLPWSNVFSYILIFICTLILSAILLSYDYSLRDSNMKEAGKVITRLFVKDYLFKDGKLNLSILSTVESYSSDLLHLPRVKNETDEEFLLRLGPIINFDFSKKME